MIERELKNFNLRQIAESGQCFRMREIRVEEIPRAKVQNEESLRAGSAKAAPDGAILAGTEEGRPRGDAGADLPEVMAYRVIAGSRMTDLVQRGSLVTFCCGEEEFPFWESYFDLQTDYSAYIASIDEKDNYLQAAAAFGSGIRILRQDVWEMIITFVISQQKTIPNIKALVEAICREYGTWIDTAAGAGPVGSAGAGAETGYYAFPSPEQLNIATFEELLALKLGYRAKYLKRICEDVCNGALDLRLLGQMRYSAAMAYLQGFYGIGEKVANCVCLFGLHHVEAFPVDTWIRRILMREYACRCRRSTLERLPEARQCKYLVRRYFARYRGYAGVMQQYLFYYERMARG